MALKKATEAKAPEESPAAAAPAAAEPVIETPVPVDSGEAAQTPALQPDEPPAPAEPVAEAPAEVEAAVAEILAAEPVLTIDLAAPAAEEEKEPFLEVVNLRKTGFRQPSTGLWIFPGEVKYLANDGWLENHVKANLLGYPKAED